jgi:signal transduction histidine kinase/ActR/RegA family two-component response regulator
MWLRKICAPALAALVFAALCGPVRAQAPNLWPPETLAKAVEKKADSTSFAKLEDFGRAALKMSGRDRLDRLYHVAWIFLNQSEFAKFEQWNGQLAALAAAEGDTRYVEVARINELRRRYDDGDPSVADEIARAAGHETDWFARIHAMRVQAYVMTTQDEVGAALRLLADADAQAVRGDPAYGMARAGVWEVEGLALMKLQDLNGASLAFGRSQFEFAPPSYPRPDFDNIYNLASLAADLGQLDMARKVAAAHHRLSARAHLDNLTSWDAILCAKVAEAGSDWGGVLGCYAPFGAELQGVKSFAPKVLPSRAIARARLGDLAAAAHDLEALRRLQASGQFDDAMFSRLPEVEAEVLRAEGHDREAYDKLRAYTERRQLMHAQRFGAGISQLTGEMSKQLGVRRLQLQTAERNAKLQQDMIRSQRAIFIVGGLLGIAVLALLLWQYRVAGHLRVARRSAEAANRAKSEFLANMSHEIRTPLNGVVAVADMLARADLEPKEREMVEIIRSSGDTLQRLLSDILDLARIESGKITIETAPFHAGAMVRDVCALSELRCNEKGVRLGVAIAPEIDGMVTGDLVRVRQVLTNFLSNAVKFTDRGRITVRAERTAEGLARFTVTDTGVGFDPADKGRVLGRFQQADSSITRRFGGTGLGLAICCELAQLMGGRVDCDSKPGEGSVFWMELPLEPAAAEAAASAPETAAADAGERSETLRVLLADDHPTNRKVVELMLGGGLADLVSVEDGQQALDALAQGRFDLVLMDMQMPVMDGLSAVREIRRREAAAGSAAIPIIMLTANALPEHVAEAAKAGADRHLGKPFTAQQLFEAIGEVLEAAEAARGAELAA